MPDSVRETTTFPTGLKTRNYYGMDNGVLRSEWARGRFFWPIRAERMAMVQLNRMAGKAEKQPFVGENGLAWENGG